MHACETFGAYAAQFQQDRLPADVLHHAQRAVVDWCAALYPGLAVAPVPQLQRLVLAEQSGGGPAQLGTGGRTGARAAALINGTAAHAAEVDDSFREAMLHPGAATVAAALAAAQQQGASGLALLRAVVLGYEVSTRIGVVMGRPHYRYWHNTGTVGSFGAAAAAACLLGLQGRAFAHALATAATFAAGLQQAFRMDSTCKPLHAGRAAEAGLLAAQLAAEGVTGSLDVLDGEAGLGRAMSEGADWSQVGDTLGQDFHVTRLTFKNHVGCGLAFAAIDAALVLAQRHALQPEDIRSVQVHTFGPALDIACHADPATEHEARFSMRYLVATALVHGSVRLGAYTPQRLNDPRTRALMQRIGTAVDADLDAAFPGHRSARVEIETTAGERHAFLQVDRKGDPELPLTDADLDGKLLELAAPVLGDAAADALRTRLGRLDQAPDVRDLLG